MKKRFLIAVVLQLLTLNLSVQASLRPVLSDASFSSLSKIEAGSDHNHEQGVPPLEEGEREAPLSESEDELSFAQSPGVSVLIPIFCFNSTIHPDQQVLEGPSSCLLKPPTGVGFQF